MRFASFLAPFVTAVLELPREIPREICMQLREMLYEGSEDYELILAQFCEWGSDRKGYLHLFTTRTDHL